MGDLQRPLRFTGSVSTQTYYDEAHVPGTKLLWAHIHNASAARFVFLYDRAATASVSAGASVLNKDVFLIGASADLFIAPPADYPITVSHGFYFKESTDATSQASGASHLSFNILYG